MAITELNSNPLRNDPNLVAYYRFEGNSNDSVGGYNGSDTNITYGLSYGRFTQGAYQATGGKTNNKIALPTTLTIPNAMTWIGWLYCLDFQSGAALSVIERDVPPGGGSCTDSDWTLRFSSTSIGTYYNYGGGCSWEQLYYPAAFQLNTWYQVGGMYNGTTKRLAIILNGQIVADAIKTNAPTVNTNPATKFCFFSTGTASYPTAFKGYLDDWAMFNRELTAQEINNIYSKYVLKDKLRPRQFGPGLAR